MVTSRELGAIVDSSQHINGNRNYVSEANYIEFDGVKVGKFVTFFPFKSLNPIVISLRLAVPLPLTSAPARSRGNLHHTSFNFSKLERISCIESDSGGTVYKVHHRSIGKIYALKVIYENPEEAVRRQIYREIEILREWRPISSISCSSQLLRHL